MESGAGGVKQALSGPCRVKLWQADVSRLESSKRLVASYACQRHPSFFSTSLRAQKSPYNFLSLCHELMLICLRTEPSRKQLWSASTSVNTNIFQTANKFSIPRRRPLSFSPRNQAAKDGRNSSFHQPRLSRTEGRAASYEGVLPRICIPSDPNNPSAWLKVVEPILPGHLRESSQDFIKETTFTEYLPQILIRARRAYNIDILSYLGLEKDRWRAVVWLVKQVIDRTSISGHALVSRADSLSFQWCFDVKENQQSWEGLGNSGQPNQPWPSNANLDEITQQSVWLENHGPKPDKAAVSLEEETGMIDTTANTGLYILRKIAVGQIWRSLGTMILAAVGEQYPNKGVIMPHVLEMIAHLHHTGMISGAVYDYSPNLSDYSLKQPPTLRVLSSRILTALSDAVWQAHELQVKEAKKATGAQYIFLGHEIPGARYRVRGVELGTEVWLELVLWSCLHGGWVEDGFAILHAIYGASKRKRAWNLLSWQDLFMKSKLEGQDYIDFSTLGTRIDVPLANVSKEELRKGRARVERTISTEVVLAYVDALVSAFRVGVGKRGIPAEVIVQNIILLKSYLDLNGMGLGAASWDALVARFIESQGIDLEEDPGFVNHMLTGLSSVYGEELDQKNNRSLNWYDSESPAYVFDGTAAVLGFYHRALRAFIARGDVEGSFRIFVRLQDYTDRNKRKAIKEFVNKGPSGFFDQWNYLPHTLAPRESSRILGGNLGNSNIATYLNTDFPAFFPKIPNPLLGSLLDLITISKTLDFGSYLISSQDIDGPSIPQSAYSDSSLAGPLIRFATATQDHDLLIRIVAALRSSHSTERNDEDSRNENELLPEEVIRTFLENQIRNRKWEAVESLLGHISDARDLYWTNTELAHLAREILLHGSKIATVLQFSDEHTVKIKSSDDLPQNAVGRSLASVLQIFLDLAKGQWGRPKHVRSIHRYLEEGSLLGLLADLGPDWAALVRDLRRFKPSQRLRLPAQLFHAVLEGVVGGHGAMAGMNLVKKWCSEFESKGPNSKHMREDKRKARINGEEASKIKEEIKESGDCEVGSIDEGSKEGIATEAHTENAEEDREDFDGTTNDLEGKIVDNGLIQDGGGVPPMAKTRPSMAAQLQLEPVRVVLDAQSDNSISFRGRARANLVTLRIILEAAGEEWKEVMARKEEDGAAAEEKTRELQAVFDWIRDSFWKFGLHHEQIAREMGDEWRNDM